MVFRKWNITNSSYIRLQVYIVYTIGLSIVFALGLCEYHFNSKLDEIHAHQLNLAQIMHREI